MNCEYQVELPHNVVIERLSDALEAAGLRVYRSFDMRNALAALPDRCTCPHHGTSKCTCQYAVLLVYGNAPAPALMVIHGRDEVTWFAIPAGNSPTPALREQIEGVALTTLAARRTEDSIAKV